MWRQASSCGRLEQDLPRIPFRSAVLQEILGQEVQISSSPCRQFHRIQAISAQPQIQLSISRNEASSFASVTLVSELTDQAGNVIASQSQAANLAPQQTLAVTLTSFPTSAGS